MTMEDVWNDISLASLCAAGNSGSATRNDPSAVRGFIFQDFMASASASASSTKLAPPSSSLAAAPLAPPPPAPATLLNLSSSGSDHFQQYQVGLKSCATTSTNTSAAPPIPLINLKLNSDTTNRVSSSLICFANKSGLEGLDSNPCCKRGALNEENGEDSRHVRHQRMIKNRESASRSRARKQAYTSELELKLELLKEENARLKIQQKKLCLGSLATPVAPARSLKRAHSL